MLKREEPRKEFRVTLYRRVLLQRLGTLIATGSGQFLRPFKIANFRKDFSPPPRPTRGGGQVFRRDSGANTPPRRRTWGFNGIDLIQRGVSDWRFADAPVPVNKPRNRIIVPYLRLTRFASIRVLSAWGTGRGYPASRSPPANDA